MIHIMLPAQYLRQAGERLAEPEKRLALAVLQTVIYDCRAAALRGAQGRARVQKRQAYDRAMAYVASPDRTWPYSFENLCETIGVDAGSLRRRLTGADLVGVTVGRGSSPPADGDSFHDPRHARRSGLGPPNGDRRGPAARGRAGPRRRPSARG
jgi:hypothetical protein